MITTLLTFLLVMLSQFSFCYGHEGLPTELKNSSGFPEMRIYFDSHQISLCEEGIIIDVDGACLLAQSIFHDGMGFYLLEEGVSWICRTCGAFNSLDDSCCYRCGES